MINIVNKHVAEVTKDDIYIGRGSPLGNPYSHMQGTKADVVVATREAAIEAYERLLRHHIETGTKPVMAELNKIAHREMDGKNTNLVCFCVPHACHGEVIKKIIMEKISAVSRTGQDTHAS